MSETPQSINRDPKSHEAGKGIEDFSQSSLTHSVKKAISLLPSKRRNHLFIVSGIQISLGVLDLLGIALIGLVAAIAVSGIDNSPLPAPVTQIANFVGLGSLTVSQLSVVVAIAAVLILVSKTVCSAILSRRIMIYLANTQAQLSVTLAREFLAQRLVFIQRWTTSEAAYALGSGTGAATVSLLGSAITIAAEIFLFIILGVSLLLFDPILTLSSLAFFSVIVFMLHRVLGKISAQTGVIMRDSSIASLTLVSEALLTFREATVLNRRGLYVSRFAEITENNARAGALTSYIMEIPKYVLEVALYLGIVLLAVIQFLTKDWAAAAATTVLFLAAGTRLIPSLLRLQGAGISIRNASASAQPTFFLADALAAQKDVDGGIKRAPTLTVSELQNSLASGYPDFTADLEVRDVSFTYSDASAPAVSGATFSASHGSSIALVGSTGAGKSTLADLVIGAISPETGQVLIGGVNPKSAIDRWPGGISYVPQSVALTTGTVRDNVALGMPSEAIDDELVVEALQRAHLEDFLRTQREGIFTNVGERGFRLSGGQRQRLGIARALYTRPKLLVLDEATSALDGETELAIVAALNELEGDVTTVTVAHRLSTVRRADLLVYLKDGKVAAQGTFEEVRSQVPDFDRQASLMGL